MRRKHPPVFTRTGWAVMWGLLLGIVAAMMLWTGCDGPAAQPLPSSVRTLEPNAPTGPVSQIPDGAIRYRKTLIRAWTYYFDFAEPVSLGAAQTHQESRWKEKARSSVGASGLAQVMPSTADWLAEMLPPEVQAACGTGKGCPEDPTWALMALARFDYLLHKGYASAADSKERWAFTYAGYNSGSGWVQKERALCSTTPSCDATRWWANTQKVCLRRQDACQETNGYIINIRTRWRPLYAAWLGE